MSKVYCKYCKHCVVRNSDSMNQLHRMINLGAPIDVIQRHHVFDYEVHCGNNNHPGIAVHTAYKIDYYPTNNIDRLNKNNVCQFFEPITNTTL